MNNESSDSLLHGRLCILQLLIVRLPKKNGRFFIEFPRHFVLIKTLDRAGSQYEMHMMIEVYQTFLAKKVIEKDEWNTNSFLRGFVCVCVCMCVYLSECVLCLFVRFVCIPCMYSMY